MFPVKWFYKKCSLKNHIRYAADSCSRVRGGGGAGGAEAPPPHFFENYKELLRKKFFQPPHFESLVSLPTFKVAPRALCSGIVTKRC